MKKLIMISMVAAFTASASLVIAAEQTRPALVPTPSVGAPVDVVETATQVKEEAKAKVNGKKEALKENATKEATKVDAGIKAIVPPVPQNK